MAHHHAPPASGPVGARYRGRVSFALVLVALYMLAEIVGGWLTGSLALLADAGHMASDAGALGLTLFAMWMSQQPAGPSRTFGYHRTEILVALVQGAALVAVAVLVCIHAVERLGGAHSVLGGPMMVIAFGGLAVNLGVLWILREGRSESLGVRAAWLHVLGDTLGSLGALGAGALIWAFGWTWADPVASMLIALLIVYSAWSLLREAVDVLMEGAPSHIDVDEVRESIGALHGVVSVHDLHVWTISSGLVSLSSHVVTTPAEDVVPVLRRVEELLGRRFGIHHATIQIEPDDGPECRPPCHEAS